MSEIRMEVLNEAEARDLCESLGYRFIKCYNGKGDNSGKLMMLADDGVSNREPDIPYEEPLNTYIFTLTNTGKMYVSDRKKCSYPTTFYINQAKLFKYSEAAHKAHFMNINGTYKWRIAKKAGS